MAPGRATAGVSAATYSSTGSLGVTNGAGGRQRQKQFAGQMGIRQIQARCQQARFSLCLSG
jgi:hypothetical protein